MIGRWLCRLGLHDWAPIVGPLTIGRGLIYCRRPGCDAADVEEE
jgi:hypothetical protein